MFGVILKLSKHTVRKKGAIDYARVRVEVVGTVQNGHFRVFSQSLSEGRMLQQKCFLMFQ